MDPLLIPALISLAGLGAIFGGGLAYASKKFYVEVDPRITTILDVLPGANCGACGKPGCSGFAAAVAAGAADASGCTPGGAEVAAKVAEIMGVEATVGEAMVAVVRCGGGKKEAVNKYSYYGIPTCVAAKLVDNGPKACEYGCTGFGDCCEVCSFDALHMGENGLPIVDDEKCTGCGLCVSACPRNIMELIPKTAQIYVACRSHDRGKAVKAVCEVGCNGCSLCANPKTTPSGALIMDDFLPREDWTIEDNLIVAKHKCPTNSFIDKVKFRPKFTIDTKCNSCGDCVKACPVKKCITGEEGQIYVIDQELCVGCGLCVPVCEPKAIHIIGALAYQQDN